MTHIMTSSKRKIEDYDAKSIFRLTHSLGNDLKGEFPNRYYEAIDSLELHYYQVSEPRAKFLVYPGGGYTRLFHDKEGVEIALWLNSLGFDAYVVTH